MTLFHIFKRLLCRAGLHQWKHSRTTHQGESWWRTEICACGRSRTEFSKPFLLGDMLQAAHALNIERWSEES